jgi:hypothetical protein
MDKPLLEALAHRAGLDRALAEFPDDLEAAAKAARTAVDSLAAPHDPACEPWPPMRTGGRP